MMVERVARLFEGDVVRQLHRQVPLRHRDDAAVFAMDRRNRRAPIALARHQPVAQAILRGAGADAQLFETGDRLGLALLDREPVEELRVDDHAILDKGRVAKLESRRIGVGWHDHGQDRQAVFLANSKSRSS